MFSVRHINSHVRLFNWDVLEINLITCINANDYHVDLAFIY